MNKKSLIIISIEILILIVGIIFANSKIVGYLPECWIYKNTGILCPGCGGTRCVINLL